MLLYWTWTEAQRFTQVLRGAGLWEEPHLRGQVSTG